MRVTTDINISIHDRREIDQPLDFAALFPTATASMRDVCGVCNLSVVILLVTISPEADEEQSGCGRVAIFDSKLLAHELGHVHSVRAVVSGLVVARYNAENLACDRLEKIDTSLQFFHRRKRRSVGIPHARRNRAVHQVSVQYAEHILVISDVIDVLLNPLMIAMLV